MWIVILVVLVVAAPEVQRAPIRVETPEALTQLIKRVDPVVPDVAIAATVGGDVIADVIVGTTGAVTSVTIIGGHDMLHAAATAALKQWRFKPFTRNGKPVSVQVILEVNFPDPARDAERRVFAEHRAAERRCLEATEKTPESAPSACAEFVRLSHELPGGRVGERSRAFILHANSLVRAGRIADAIAEIERSINLRHPTANPADADIADGYYAIGMLHQQMGNVAAADTSFTTSVRMHAAALKALPMMRDLYLPRYQRTLQAHAALKRKMGDTSAAESLEERARGLPSVKLPDPSRAVRTSGDLRILEPTVSPLPETELAGILAALARSRVRAWMLMHFGPPDGPHDVSSRWIVDAYLTPSAVTATTRRGELVFVVRQVATGGTVDGPWQVQKVAPFWAQVALAGGDPAAELPIKIQPAPNNPPPTMSDIVDLLRFLRSQADVKPWPVEVISYGRDGASVTLEDHATRKRQHLTVRREVGAWRITDVR